MVINLYTQPREISNILFYLAPNIAMCCKKFNNLYSILYALYLHKQRALFLVNDNTKLYYKT